MQWVGRPIINQENDALTKFEELTKSTDADRIELFRVPGAAALVKPNLDRGCPVDLVESNHDGASQTSNNAEQQQTAAAHTISVADPYIAAQEAAWTLVTGCRKVQWASMQLITENIRLKSWDAFYINTVGFIIGWDEPTIKSVRKALNQGFYNRVFRI